MSPSGSSPDVASDRSATTPSQVDRRIEPRVAREIEVVVVWSHAPQSPMRYRATEFSMHGLRLRSVLPVQHGARGKILASLPHGALPNGNFEVMWCRRLANGEAADPLAYEAGCRFEA